MVGQDSKCGRERRYNGINKRTRSDSEGNSENGVGSKTFSLCALVSVNMIYTQFRINKSWEEMLRSEDSVVLMK